MNNNQKLDPLLNTALAVEEVEGNVRQPELFTGFSSATGMWEVIVRYTGDPRKLQEAFPKVLFQVLGNEYGIALLPQEELTDFSKNEQVIYIEKVTPFTYSQEISSSSQGISPLTGSCLSPLLNAPYYLNGEGTIIAIIDNGIDFSHPVFRDETGKTRFLYYWDQSIPGSDESTLPAVSYGRSFSFEQINAILLTGTQTFPVTTPDLTGHGTAVAGIAATIASKAKFIGVKLGKRILTQGSAIPQSAEIMLAVDYVYRCVELLSGKNSSVPLVVNLSLGNSEGDHEGNTLLETYLNTVSDKGRSIIIVGTGNEGSTGRHAQVRVNNRQDASTLFNIAPFQPAFSMQLWKNFSDLLSINLIHPNGTSISLNASSLQLSRTIVSQTEIQAYLDEPSPYTTEQMLWISFVPLKSYVDSGTWQLQFTPQRIRDGFIRMWLPSGANINQQTRFLTPDANGSFTIPSTASKVISVSAYNYRTQSVPDFSGRGFLPYQNKPDLCAPGVNILAPVAASRIYTQNHPNEYAAFTGTSFAAPIVSGTCALLMQWGILQGNDPFLYGEKIKAVLRRYATPLSVGELLPNNQSGYGTLCAFIQSSGPSV